MMNQYKALVFDPDTCLERDLKRSGPLSFNLSRTRSFTELAQSISSDSPDIVVLHVDMPEAKGIKLFKKFRKLKPNMPTLLILSHPKAADWSQLDQYVDLVRAPFDVSEVKYRIEKLLSAHWQSPIPTLTALKGLPGHVVKELHNPKSGRIDAEHVSELFGLPVAALARTLKTKPSTLAKTPDAPNLQSKLGVYERIAWAATRLAGSAKALKIWLNAPNPRLDGIHPIELVKAGRAELVLNMLEDALLGHPN